MTRAYPHPGVAHVPRGRLPAQRLRRVFGAPPAGAPLSLHAAWQPKVQVLTCACPLASRAACRPHEPSVQSAPFRSSVAALASRSPRSFARSSESLRARSAQRPGCPVREPAVHCRYNYRSVHCRSRECRTHTVLGLPADWSVAGGPTCTGDARFSLRVRSSGPAARCLPPRPAPLRVACLSFGFVDADLPDSRCRRCRQSDQPASTFLLTAPPACRTSAGQPSAEPKNLLGEHKATYTAEKDSVSSLFHENVSL